MGRITPIRSIGTFMDDMRERVKKIAVHGHVGTLADMTNIGLPVPFGLTVTTQACNISPSRVSLR